MIRVDGRPVEPRGTLLETCRAAGADVPAFCHDDRLSPGGHCRACMVELDGRMVAACTTHARGGDEVTTRSPRLDEYRRDLGELMLSESRPQGWVGAQLSDWGATGRRYGLAPPTGRRDHTHPYLRLDLDRCILCRRCVRACDEIQGQFVYAIEGRGHDARLAWAGERFADSGCVSCGACVEACPTGAISDLDRAASHAAEAITSTTCGYCGVGCQLDVAVAHDRVVRIEGGESPVNRGHLCGKGRYAHGFARHPDRLRAPLIRKGGALVEASWEEVLARVAEAFTRLRGRLAGLSSSRCTNEENYLFQKWFRGGLGTHDVDCCARVCHAPSAAGMRAAFGTGAATASFDDIERADLIWITGANPTVAHPVVGARIRQAALAGARLIVVDPRRIELAAIADLHLQVKPGGNVPLLNAVASALLRAGHVHRDFVAARTEGWEAYEAFIRGETPERNAALSGVAAAEVREAARMLGHAERPLFMHGLGVTEHLQGSEAVMLLCNLAMLLGAVGRPGAGVSPLRGQNNVQGAADMGCQPDLLTGYASTDDPEARARFEKAWGRTLPTAKGRTLPEMYQAATRGEIAGLYVFGEDVVQTDPDTGQVRAALASLEFLVVQELFLSETAKLAHVVLPGASFLEKDGTFTNGERRVQRVRRALPPIAGARADWEILIDLMERTGWKQELATPAQIWDEIARVAPPFAGISYARLEAGGLQWPVPDATHPGTTTLHVDSFPRGRGRLSVVPFVPSPSMGGPLTLVTGRALEHYNAGTMTRRTPNLALRGEDVLEIHPDDALARSLEDGARVRVKSEQGEAFAVARVTDRVRPGSAFLTFHFPETCANAVTGEVKDRISGCPEYKVTAVEVTRA